MGKYTFQDFRNRISIIEIAEKLGYWWNKEKGGLKAHTHTYTLGDKKNPQDEIVIYNPYDSSKQSYFSRRGGFDDKGNLINFVLNRLDRFAHDSNGFEAVNDILARYLGDNTEIKSASTTAAPSVEFNIKHYIIEPAKLSDFKFLTQVRKISEKTVLDFIKIFAIYKVQHISHNYYNCGFPFRMPGRIDITNFSLRNYNWSTREGYKRFCEGGDKSNSCWIAAFTAKENITDLYLFESEIDAMSYYELKGFTTDTTAAFVSLGGNVIRSQIEGLRKEYPNVRFHCCYDNDTQGLIYDVTTCLWLQGIDCKGFKEYPTNNPVFDFGDGNKEILDKESFNSESYLRSKGIDACPIHKPGYNRKDYNEELVYLKRLAL